jgi:hypothetical protein
MSMGSPPRRDSREAWNRLSELMEEHSVDVALLNEVSTELLAGVEGALYEVWGTRGRDLKRREWCTVIVSPHGRQEVRDARAVSTGDAGRMSASRTRARDRGSPVWRRSLGSAK